jgi:periplasmic copper chaperone A
MRSLLTAVLIVLPVFAVAKAAYIQVDHVWSRPVPAGGTGVVYLTITNQGAADVLTAVSSPVATKSDLYESFDDHGVMKMRRVINIPVTSGRNVTFAPGGYHIMLTSLKQALVGGTIFPVTLSFAYAGQVTAMASVQNAGVAVPTRHHGGK